MSLDFTDTDLLLLEKQRLARFRELFSEALAGCFLFFDRKNTLAIHCTEAWMVDHLLEHIDQVAWQAWVVVGVYQLSIYFAQEEIYAAPTHSLKKARRTLRGAQAHPKTEQIEKA
jgi:hypothetical protein